MTRGHSHPRLRAKASIPSSMTTITLTMIQKAPMLPCPGTPVFIPQIPATRVSGRNTTVSTVRTRRTSLSWWVRTDSLVSSSASAVSLKPSSICQMRSEASLMSSK